MRKFVISSYVLNPSVELRPTIRISPFSTKYVGINKGIYEDAGLKTCDLLKEFAGDKYEFFSSGRVALENALAHYGLQATDNVWIVTTSGNSYISGCVTKVISKFCSWSRTYTESTKVILVNHEFGYPFTNWELLDFGLPIIEDVAHSFFSTDATDSIRNIGEYTVYSLPKYFPIPFGGLLKINCETDLKSNLNSEESKYLSKLTNYYLQEKDAIVGDRIRNYNYLVEKLQLLNCVPFFKLDDNVIPGVFLFKTPIGLDLDKLKVFMQANGVESSVFYGEQAFFIPVNQNLEIWELDYMIELLKIFYYEHF